MQETQFKASQECANGGEAALPHHSDLDLSAQEPHLNNIARKSHATSLSLSNVFVLISKLRAVELLLGKAL